jgi:hypothetical protein
MMNDYNSVSEELTQYQAIIQLCKDLLEHKKRDTKLLFIGIMIQKQSQ